MNKYLANYPGYVGRFLLVSLIVFYCKDGSVALANQSDQVLLPQYSGKDHSREKIGVILTPIIHGLRQPTNLQFVPGYPDVLAITQKAGVLHWANLKSGSEGNWLTLDVLTHSEQGLLGLAFHPRFAENRQFFLNYSTVSEDHEVSRVERWEFDKSGNLYGQHPKPVHTLLEVVQPFANHNAGQLTFGMDGDLYIGWGDGGGAGDPRGNGQNPKTMLGSMLRIDVDHNENGRHYAIPADNPFIGNKAFLPEIWAWGFRNPWRYSFDPLGRLIVADVGQQRWEEISIVEKGRNYGWNIKEGFHCFNPPNGCNDKGLTNPVYEYGHDEGRAITGGYVYQNSRIAKLTGKYVFGDFASGRIWAIDLPQTLQSSRDIKAYALGRFPIMISTFGKNDAGNIFVADYKNGVIYRIDPPK